MSEFTVAVVERPAIRTAGLKIRTTMEKATQDCTKLWTDDFAPRMESFPADPARPDESYGLSVMVDSDAFDYWAVMPIAADAQIPEGMDVITIPAGTYAECRVASLERLGDAFNNLYCAWIPQQETYSANMQGIGYELYTSEYMENGSLTIYCPLLEK